METQSPFIRWFSELGMADVPLVGGKNASLGEMFGALRDQGLRVPDGFAVTAVAYKATLDRADAWQALHAALDGLDPADVEDLARRGARARDIVCEAPLPPELEAGILQAHAALREEYGEAVTVAVRSSATAEDLPTASFAGQHESYLNIAGGRALLDSVRRCFASLFTDRAIVYRIENGFDHFKVWLSVGVMKMVRADLTQLVLGVDRDSDLVAFDFDERDPGVLELLRQAIVGAKRNGRHVGICGQAPSDYPEVTGYLVEQGIDAISLNPDSVVATVRNVVEVERALGMAPRAGT